MDLIYQQITNLFSQLTAKDWRLACAESLTGGLLSSTICDVPGASQVYAGGITTYQTPTKHQILQVDQERLAQTGPVDAVVAEQMAQGAANLFNTQVAVSTTGVAGPQAQDGQPVGKVFISVLSPQGSITKDYLFTGDRTQIRHSSVKAAIDLLTELLAVQP